MWIVSHLPARFDELGLRKTLADRVVTFLVTAMAFLAALAIVGWIRAAELTGDWANGASAALTVQVPKAGEPNKGGARTRLAAVLALLTAAPGVESAEVLSDDRLNALLRPWLGADVNDFHGSIPAVIAVHTTRPLNELTILKAQVEQTAPGTIVEDYASWAAQLGTLARGLLVCSGLMLLIVTMVMATVIAVVTHVGLATRRQAMLIVCQLGATDDYLTRQFAMRVALSAFIGGVIGELLAFLLMITLTALPIPLAGGRIPVMTAYDAFSSLRMIPWWLPGIIPAAASVIGYLTTQVTMRLWLRQLQ